MAFQTACTLHTHTRFALLAGDRLGRSGRMRAADREAAAITRVYNWMLLAAGVAHNGLPLLVLLVRYAHGVTLGPMAEWPQPFSGVYAFDATRTPGYQFAYVLGIMYNINVAHYYACNDMLYLAVCRYAVAYMDGWTEDWAAVEAEYERRLRFGGGGGRHRRVAAGRRLEQRMKRLIRSHYHILE